MNSLTAIAALLTASLLLPASTDPSIQELLTAARQQASLFYHQSSPFQLEVDFLAQMNVPVQGHLTLKWEAERRWWRRVVMDNFEQVEILDGDKHYTARNLSFTPIRIGELFSLLQLTDGSDVLMAKKIKQGIENGIEVTCVKVEPTSVKGKPHEVCINPISREVLSDDWQEPPDEHRTETYTDYFDFAGHRYPRKLQLLVNGSRVITANVESLAPATFDRTLLVPPAGAVERRQCPDMKHPVPIRTPDPAYPKSASQNRLTGDTTVAMTILADGSVTDIHIVGSAVRSMDDSTLQTLKSWRFKPAMCGAEPVVSDIKVVVSFRLR